MTALLTGIKLQTFKRQEKKTSEERFGPAAGFAPADGCPGGRQWAGVRAPVPSRSRATPGGCTHTHAWVDDRVANALTPTNQFPKEFSGRLPLSSPTASRGGSAVLTPRSAAAAPSDGLPCLGAHSPQMCSPHTPERDLKLRPISCSTETFQQFPVACREKIK